METPSKEAQGEGVVVRRAFRNWLTTGQAAEVVKRSRNGVVWMAERGTLEAVLTPLGWLIDPEKAREFAAKEEKEGRRGRPAARK